MNEYERKLYRIYKQHLIHYTWYNVETPQGGAISFRLHDDDKEQITFERRFGNVIEEGESCAIAWVKYTDIKGKLREHEFAGMQEVLDFIDENLGDKGDGLNYISVNLACPCNSRLGA